MYEKHFTVKKKQFEKLKEAINKVQLHILLKLILTNYEEICQR